MLRQLVLFGFGVFICAHLPVCRLAAQTAAAAPSAESVARGKAAFEKSCSFCHGSDATGAEGPSLVLSAVVRHDQKGETVGPVIREGRVSKGMPAFPSLTPEQISDITAFLHARITELDRRSAGRPQSNYSLKLLLTGDATKGKAFFEGDGGCVKCHSVSGDLKGVAKKYPPIELQTRFLYPEPDQEQATVTLPTGKKMTGEVVHRDAFTIALRDADGWYHSWPVQSVKIDAPDKLAGHRALLKRYTQADMHNLFAYLETLQ